MGFKLKAADGTALEIADGDFYFNTKARGRRMMANSLSSDARRVYACLELATMGFQQELAVTMDGGKVRLLSPSDVCQQTKLSKQNVRRAFEELEDQGLAKREADDGKALRRGHVRLYSWAEPHPTRPNIKEVVARDYFPSWFPDSWAPLRSFICRYKYSLPADEVVARDYIEEGEAVARAYQQTDEVVTRFLERVCAPPQSADASLYERTEITLRERTSSSSAVVSEVQASRRRRENRRVRAKTAEDDDVLSLYQKFKSTYPASHFDEAKAKPSFDGKTKAQRTLILDRLLIYLSCERWQDDGGRWIPLASNWLQTYDADPPPALKKKAASAKKGFADSVMEEAQRRFNNGTL